MRSTAHPGQVQRPPGGSGHHSDFRQLVQQREQYVSRLQETTSVLKETRGHGGFVAFGVNELVTQLSGASTRRRLREVGCSVPAPEHPVREISAEVIHTGELDDRCLRRLARPGSGSGATTRDLLRRPNPWPYPDDEEAQEP